MITTQQSELLKWHDETIEWLGAKFDKDEVVKELKTLINMAKAAGLSQRDEFAGTHPDSRRLSHREDCRRT